MKSKSFLLAAFALIAITSLEAGPPYAGRTPGNKLTASDAGDSDWFGNSVAISGNRVVVGANLEDGSGSARGAAYVYDIVTGAELVKLTASDAQDSDLLGVSVSVSGNVAVVGASGDDDGGSGSGAAYVFDLSTGTELFKLTASDAKPSDFFGISVAASGNLAVVGANQGDGAVINSGTAYVFDLATGAELFELSASDGESSDAFGDSVAVSGDLAVIGAKFASDGGLASGAAYVYDLTTGTELFKLISSDAEESDGLGTSVAVAGNRAVIGSSGDDDGGFNSGAAYVFDLSNGVQLFKLTASDAEANDRFGTTVAVSGNLVVVGASEEDGFGSRRGAVYVFDLATGVELYKLTASDAANSDRFGNSVAISGNFAISGASLEDGAGSDRGAVYVFQIDQFQPDNIAGRRAFTGVGSNIHNSSGAGQTQSLVSSKLRPVRGFFTVTSAGDRGEDFFLSATPGDAFFAVQYYRQSGPNRTNVTAALVAGTHRELNVVPEEPGRVIGVDVNPSPKLKKRIRRKGRLRTTYLRKTFLARLTSTSTTHDFKSDAAIVRVMTR